MSVLRLDLLVVLVDDDCWYCFEARLERSMASLVGDPALHTAIQQAPDNLLRSSRKPFGVRMWSAPAAVHDGIAKERGSQGQRRDEGRTHRCKLPSCHGLS